jgi:hypothetical protein
MSVDCQWVEKNLEALFCDRLNETDTRLLRSHIDRCESCRREADALNAIDPLIKNHFQRELEIARRVTVPRGAHKSRVLGLTGAGAAVVAALLILTLRAPQTPPALSPVVRQTAPVATSSSEQLSHPDQVVQSAENQTRPTTGVVPPPSAQTPPTSPSSDAREPQVAESAGVRTKPTTGVVPSADHVPSSPPIPSEREFLVVDPAGYSHTLEEYRGHVVVIAVWSPAQKDSIRNLERLYRTYAGNPKFRFLGISHQLQAKPGSTTFPMMYNQGSRLFGAEPGEFVLLDENGTPQLRGSLVNDIDALRKALQEK